MTTYADITARMGERLLAAEDARTAAREAREDQWALKPHRFVADEFLPGFCHLCRVNQKRHA